MSHIRSRGAAVALLLLFTGAAAAAAARIDHLLASESDTPIPGGVE
ncbi:MAG: hypothetical protein Q8P41_29025 [Pseudomonadota bacterium]|nr:hypothetical protein [Pseudomonadota bacterium]